MHYGITEYKYLLKLMYFMNQLLDFGTGVLEFKTDKYNYIVNHNNYSQNNIQVRISCQDLYNYSINNDFMKLSYMSSNIQTNSSLFDHASWEVPGNRHIIHLHGSCLNLHRIMIPSKGFVFKTCELQPIVLNRTEIERIEFTYNLLNDKQCFEFVLASLMIGQREALSNTGLYDIGDLSSIESPEIIFNALCEQHQGKIRYRGLLEKCLAVEFKSESV